MLFIISRM